MACGVGVREVRAGEVSLGGRDRVEAMSVQLMGEDTCG